MTHTPMLEEGCEGGRRWTETGFIAKDDVSDGRTTSCITP